MFTGKALAFLIFFILYLLLGGFLFNAIECPGELAKLKRDSLHSPSEDFGSLGSVGYRDSKRQAEHCEVWSFYNSVFFAFTSITTIGYGRAAPKTQMGRGVLLIYSLFGIPISGILIGTIGAFFSIKVSYLWLKE